jgi:uncharacterized protein with HEPN domain
MKHPERVEDYLEHIIQAIQRATSYIEDFENAEALQQDSRTQDAVIRNIEIIGEAANHLQNMSPAFVANHPELPWLEMRGMRNKVAHEYFDVDWDMVWDTVKDDLPQLKQQIDGLLTVYRQEPEEQQDEGQDQRP